MLWRLNRYSVQNANFSGTGRRRWLHCKRSAYSGGGGGLPDGDFTLERHGVTATDFIATSDERVKDNITTAPVGLIDNLKGREWDWSESLARKALVSLHRSLSRYSPTLSMRTRRHEVCQLQRSGCLLD